MEDLNLHNYNQHQMIRRAPTLMTRPSLVFLAPNKKGLRNPILKCKPQLAILMSLCHCPNINLINLSSSSTYQI